jgi:hypothetical protein
MATRASLFLPVFLLACGEKEEHEPAISDVEVQDDALVVHFATGVYGWQCSSSLVQVHQADDSDTLQVLETDPDRVGNLGMGYWLDGEFRYPSFDEGCDVMQCIALEERTIGRIAYSLTGTDAPPDDLQAYHDDYGWGAEVPDEVEVVEGQRYAGEVVVTVEVHRVADCSDAEVSDDFALAL